MNKEDTGTLPLERAPLSQHPFLLHKGAELGQGNPCPEQRSQPAVQPILRNHYLNYPACAWKEPKGLTFRNQASREEEISILGMWIMSGGASELYAPGSLPFSRLAKLDACTLLCPLAPLLIGFSGGRLLGFVSW